MPLAVGGKAHEFIPSITNRAVQREFNYHYKIDNGGIYL
jgi:hypothetical protein